MSKLDKLFSRDVAITKVSKSSDSEDSPDIYIEGYANFGAKDRAGDLIDPSVWSAGESLNNFKKNPILLFNHDYDEPIGKVEDIDARTDGLFIRAKITAAAGKVYKLIADGILSTFSVGFRLLDAKWIGETETFLITKVELLEISVVSVPCQQDSVFSLAKSMNGEDYLAIRKTFGPKQSSITGVKKNMGDENQLNIDELAAKLGLSNLAKNVDAILAVQQAEAEKKAAEKKATEEENRMKALIAAATGEEKQRLEEALALTKTLEQKLDESNKTFVDALKQMQDQVQSKSAEIAQLMAARDNKAFVKAATAGLSEENMEKCFLLSKVMKTSLDATNLYKAVNASSSVQVSSEDYETVFSQRILQDVQKALVVGNLFEKMPLASRYLKMMIEPEATAATWVDASAFGTDASTGSEQTTALTEKTFETFKLAAHAFLTDETAEDSVVAVLPILRRRLVQSIVIAVEQAFMTGTGIGQPKGLVTAGMAEAKLVTTATYNGTVKATLAMLDGLREKLGRHGIDKSKIAYIVSLDAYWKLRQDPAFADVSQVGVADAIKLTGEVMRCYDVPVLVSEYFPTASAGSAWAVAVYLPNFVVPEQRSVTVESERIAKQGKDAFYVSTRLNLQRFIEGKGVAAAAYAA